MQIGVIRSIEPLDYEKNHNHILQVVAFDCGMKRSEPVLVSVKVNRVCRLGWTGAVHSNSLLSTVCQHFSFYDFRRNQRTRRIRSGIRSTGSFPRGANQLVRFPLPTGIHPGSSHIGFLPSGQELRPRYLHRSGNIWIDFLSTLGEKTNKWRRSGLCTRNLISAPCCFVAAQNRENGAQF